VYVDTVSLGSADSIATVARARGVRTVLICPPPRYRHRAFPLERIIVTDDFSVEGLDRLLRRLDQSYIIRGIHSSFGPFRVDGFLHGAVATLAGHRGLAHSPVDALAAATNKYLARARLAAARVERVPFALATSERSLLDAARMIGYPIVLKPLTGVGSSLIMKCTNDSDAIVKFRRAIQTVPHAYYDQLRMAPHTVTDSCGHETRFDPAEALLVERYLHGREASVECAVSGTRVTPLVVHDKLEIEEADGVVFEHLLVSPPARFTTRETDQLKSHAAAAVRALGLRDTFCHVELRYVDGEGPRVLEVNPRIGAGCVTDSIETFTTLSVDATRVSMILGESLPPIRRRRARRHAMVFLFSPRGGTLAELSDLDKINAMPEVRIVRVGHRPGDRVGGDTEEIFLASIWLQADDETRARRSYEHIRKTVSIRVV
jgi:biotin carboxylase